MKKNPGDSWSWKKSVLLMVPIFVGFITPSLVIFGLEVIVGKIAPLKSIGNIIYRQFASGHNLFLLAVFGLIPFGLLMIIVFICSFTVSWRRVCYLTTGGIVGILALMVPAHINIWYPLYGPGRMSSTAVIGFVFIPFYCIPAMLTGVGIGFGISLFQDSEKLRLKMKKKRIVLGLMYLVVGIGLCGCDKVVDAKANVRLKRELSDASVMVYPTFVRKFSGSVYDSNSAREIAAALKDIGFKSVIVSNDKVPIAGETYMIQWKLFNQSKDLFVSYLKANPVDTDYVVLAEYLITPLRSGGQAAGGIHCFVLDGKGRVGLEVLLNSHHEIFAEAKTTEDCTKVLIRALKKQLEK